MKPKPKKIMPAPKPPPEQAWWIVGSPRTGYQALWASRADTTKFASTYTTYMCRAKADEVQHRKAIERELLRWLEGASSRPLYSQRLEAQAAAKKLRVELSPGDPCASKGCPNRKNQGMFVGEYCAACHTRLTRTPWVPEKPRATRVKPKTPSTKKPAKKVRR